MSKLTNVSKEEKKMLRSVYLRSFTLFASVTQAKMGASGFCYSMLPFINHFYKDDPEGKKKALVRHMSYFNTTVPFSSFVMGLCGAMEKENCEKKDFNSESINSIKTSLMGPLAGIGDSIFWGVWRVICAGIAISMAQAGNVLAPLVFFLLFNIPTNIIRYYGGFLGYTLGSSYIEKLYSSGLINILTKAANILGLIMVGGMTSSMVTFNSIVKMTVQGKEVFSLQNMLDQIFIGIVPLGLTLLCFYLLTKKKVSINVLIIGVIILGIALSVLGIA